MIYKAVLILIYKAVHRQVDWHLLKAGACVLFTFILFLASSSS